MNRCRVGLWNLVNKLYKSAPDVVASKPPSLHYSNSLTMSVCLRNHSANYSVYEVRPSFLGHVGTNDGGGYINIKIRRG